MKKRMLSMLLALCMVLALIPVGAGAEEITGSYGSLTYTVSSAGEITITDCDQDAQGVIEVPAQIDGKPVTAIGEEAFNFCSGVTDIVLPDSVQSIGRQAFAFSGVTNMVLPDGIPTIEENLFYYCENLTSVYIPDSVTAIKNWAFVKCVSLKEIEIPDSVSVIENAFGGSGLTQVTIGQGNGSIEIQDWAFQYCHSLSELNLSSSVVSVGELAFAECENLTQVTIPSSVSYIGKHAFGYVSGENGETLNDGFTIWGDSGSAAEAYALDNGIDYVVLFLDDDGHRGWSWASDYIYACVGAGLLSGYPDGTFLPDKDISRIEFVSVLYKTYQTAGGEMVYGENPFTDATSGWYQEALIWAYTTGLTTGKTETTFAPNDNLSRAELVTFLYRYLTTFYEGVTPGDGDLSGFEDASQVPAYAREAMSFCVENGIVNGSTPTTLAPKDHATRGQTAAIFARTFLELE